MWQGILSTLFPKRCIGCEIIISSQQLFLCESCRSNLPLTYLPLNNDNYLYHQLCQSVQIESAASFLFFTKKNITQKLIHYLKYKNHPEIGSWLAEIWFEQNKDNPKLREIETIIPVPIHAKRLRKRSYNQITQCSKKLASLLSCNYDEHLLQRISHMESQTQSGKYERINRMKNTFKRTNQSSNHYLLVDDVFTTGATLISCTEELLKANNAKVSIFTLAIA